MNYIDYIMRWGLCQEMVDEEEGIPRSLQERGGGYVFGSKSKELGGFSVGGILAHIVK